MWNTPACPCGTISAVPPSTTCLTIFMANTWLGSYKTGVFPAPLTPLECDGIVVKCPN